LLTHYFIFHAIAQAFRIVTSLPVVLLRSASKQLHEGYKAAKHRLSSGGKSFSDREGGSRSASFDSTASDVKMGSRHSQDFSMAPDSNQKSDDAQLEKIVPECPPFTPSLMGDGGGGGGDGSQSPKRQFSGFFATPKHTKSKVTMTPQSSSRVPRFFHRNGSSGANRISKETAANVTAKTAAGDTCSGDGSLSHLMSPQLSESGSSLSQHITSMLHSSFSSLKKGLDGSSSMQGHVAEDILNGQSSSDDDSSDDETDSEDEAPTKPAATNGTNP